MTVCPKCKSTTVFLLRFDSDWCCGLGDYYPVNDRTEYTEKEWGILKESKKKRNWREAYQKVVDRGIQMAVRGQNNYPKRFEELAWWNFQAMKI